MAVQTLTHLAYLLNPPLGVLDGTVVTNLFPGHTEGARKAVVHRAVSSGEVLRLKPGLLCLAEPYRRAAFHPFALASVLLSPSHISLESALWHHGLIPEGVRGVSSVTTLRSRTFETPVGEFSYQRVPVSLPRGGVRVTEVLPRLWAFIATPLRAIADLVYVRRSVTWRSAGIRFLTDSLRIEPDDLLEMPVDDAEEVLRTVTNGRTVGYIAALLKELNR